MHEISAWVQVSSKSAFTTRHQISAQIIAEIPNAAMNLVSSIFMKETRGTSIVL